MLNPVLGSPLQERCGHECRPQESWRIWSIYPVRRGLESWGWSVWRRGGLGGFSSVCIYAWTEGIKRTEARLYSAMPSDSTRISSQKLEHGRFALNTWKHFCGDDGALAKVQRQWSLLLEDLWELLGCGPEHNALGGPAWAGSPEIPSKFSLKFCDRSGGNKNIFKTVLIVPVLSQQLSGVHLAVWKTVPRSKGYIWIFTLPKHRYMGSPINCIWAFSSSNKFQQVCFEMCCAFHRTFDPKTVC